MQRTVCAQCRAMSDCICSLCPPGQRNVPELLSPERGLLKSLAGHTSGVREMGFRAGWGFSQEEMAYNREVTEKQKDQWLSFYLGNFSLGAKPRVLYLLDKVFAP